MSYELGKQVWPNELMTAGWARAFKTYWAADEVAPGLNGRGFAMARPALIQHLKPSPPKLCR